MDRDTELLADHLPLEEVLISEIDGLEPPENWSSAEDDSDRGLPPVLIEEDRGYSLVGNHRTVWHLKSTGRTLVKCLVVRSSVHVRPAHALISNCTEEAMLFEALLRREIVANRSRLADMLSYSRARITQLLNLLKLPLDIRQKVLVTDAISEFQLRQLLKVLDDENRLQEGFQKLLEKKLSGRQMALFASKEPVPETGSGDPSEETRENTGSVKELEDVFSETEGAEPSAAEPSEEKESGDSPFEETDRENGGETIAPPDMKEVLRSMGNLRDRGWRTRAALYALPPLEIDFLEGVSLMRTGLYTKAIEILAEVVARDSSHHLGWFYLGRCSNLTGALQEAEEYLRNAVSQSPDDPDYIVELAIVLEKLKRHTEAEAFYRKSAVVRKKLASEK